VPRYHTHIVVHAFTCSCYCRYRSACSYVDYCLITPLRVLVYRQHVHRSCVTSLPHSDCVVAVCRRAFVFCGCHSTWLRLPLPHALLCMLRSLLPHYFCDAHLHHYITCTVLVSPVPVYHYSAVSTLVTVPCGYCGHTRCHCRLVWLPAYVPCHVYRCCGSGDTFCRLLPVCRTFLPGYTPRTFVAFVVTRDTRSSLPALPLT